jgi:hypothetical protein
MTLGEIAGLAFLILFIGYFALLFYADSKAKPLTNHLDLPWYRYDKRFTWLRQNVDRLADDKASDARHALRARSLAGVCIWAMVLFFIAAAFGIGD